MKSYTSLRTIAGIFNVLGYIIMISGIVLGAVFIATMADRITSGADFVLTSMIIGVMTYILAVTLSCLSCWGVSQFIKLMINTADSIKNMEHNVYLMTERTQVEA